MPKYETDIMPDHPIFNIAIIPTTIVTTLCYHLCFELCVQPFSTLVFGTTTSLMTSF